MKRFKKLSKKIIFLLSALLVVGVLIAGYLYFFSKPAVAAWFNELWLYRIPLTITHNAEVLNNKVKFDIDTATLITAGKMQPDCGDTRFTDINGKLLKYYLDSSGGACNTNSTDYYVLIPTIINGTTVIYHYYGNPSAPNGTQAAQFSEATLTPSGSYAAGSEAQGPGPVGYWKFDDGQGQTAQDSSSSGNDGTLGANSGSSTDDPTWQPEDRCVAGKCLYFDGSNDYVDLTNNNSFDFTSTSKWTLSAWIKTSTSADNAIISRMDANQDFKGYEMMVVGSNGHIAAGLVSAWTTNNTHWIESTNTVNDGNWHHVVFTYDGSETLGGLKIYRDGKLETPITIKNGFVASSAIDPDKSVKAGARTNNTGIANPFNGTIDEPKVYPYARTAAQVKTDYLGGAKNAAAHSGTSAVLGARPQDYLSNGLVGYWKMDDAGIDAEGESSTDSSGNSNTGTLYGDNGVGDNGTGMNCTASGKFGSGCNFDGVDDYISLDPSTAFDVGSTGDFSASLWVKSSATNDNHLLRAQSDNDNYWSLYHEGSDDLMRFRIQNGSGNSDVLAATTTVENGNWHFVTIVRKNSGTRMEIYIDGALNNSSTSTARSPGTIGQFRIAEGAGNYIDATIDEVRVYNRALTSAEISSLYNWAPGPVGYWDFEAGSGTSVVDKSGNSNTGTWNGTGTKHWDTGKYGKAGKFNGSDDFLSASRTLLPSGLTYEAWIKTTSTDSTAGYEGNAPLNVIGDHTVNIDVGFGVSNGNVKYNHYGGSWQSVTGTKTVNDGKWHFISATHNTAGAVNVYVDGVLDNSGTITYATANTAFDRIGGGYLDGSGTGDFFDGQIDEVKIYNYARTQKQIVSDMNGGHPAVGSPVGSAIGHWKFDEGQGIVANNSGSGGATLNGTLTSMASPAISTSGWTQSGKFGKGLIFDGSNDYVTITDPGANSALDMNGQITMSAWIKTSSTNDYSGLIHKADNTSKGYQITTGTSGNLRMDIYNGTGYGTAQTTGVNVIDGAWHLITATYDGSTAIIYVDGVQKASSPLSGYLQTNSNDNSALLIGNDDGGASRYFTGSIDDAKIYNYALTADEVKTEYNKGSSLVLGTAGDNSSYAKGAANQEYCVPGDSSTCTAPIAEWKFEEAGTVGVGSTAYDTSGNNKSGAWAGTSTTHTVSGKFGKAGKFNGTDDFVDIPTNTVFNDVRTISAWFKITGGAGTDRLIVARDIAAGLGGGWGIAVAQNNQVRYHMNIGGTWRSFDGSTPALNTWYFVAATYDGTALRGYLNGVPDGSSAQTGALGTGTNPVRIGGDSTGGTNRTMVGSIDQVRIFDYARSAAQIAYDYNRGAPVGHWKLDECQGATAYDSSGNKNNGTITVGASGSQASLGTCAASAATAWYNGRTGKYNSSLNFDGTDDYIDIGNQTPFQFGTGDFSASFWMKANAWSGYTAPLSNSVYTSSWDGFHFEEEAGGGGCTTGGIRFEFPDNTRACWNSVINTGTWYHVVGVRRSGTATIYVNGVAGGSSSGTTANVNVARDFLIGRNPDTTYPRYFNGQIDDVRIFNYALTPLQIKDVYNNGAVNFGPVSGAP